MVKVQPKQLRRYAILGHPVSHSLSPKFHNAVFQQLGLKDHHYDFYDCPPERLEAALRELREGKYQGFSVTIPHKQAVMKFCDELSDRAKRVGAVNTLIRKNDGKIFGDNTDYVGVEKSLEEGMGRRNAPSRNGGRVPTAHYTARHMALVLGSGGAAKAVIAVLRDQGMTVTVASRSKQADVKTYDELNPDGDYELIVNTTPVGMVGNEGLILTDPRWYRKDRIYFDVVYTPRITPFLERARDAGAKIITGDRMFFWQAVGQAQLFTGSNALPEPVLEKMKIL